MSEPITVLVVDDSAFMRKMVSTIIDADPDLKVIGRACNGIEAVQMTLELKPQVVTLDIEMPVMNGLEALDELMTLRPTPVVMLSSRTQKGAEATLRCLEHGAVDFVGKPSGGISLDIAKIAEELIEKIKVAAAVPMHRLKRTSDSRLKLVSTSSTLRPSAITRANSSPEIIVIGASTGGPRALHELLTNLPASLDLPIIVVQHMPVGFTASLARRLNNDTPFSVREAVDGDTLEKGVCLIAPGGRHLVIDPSRIARLSDDPAVHGVRPAIDVTLASVVHAYGAKTLAVLLTGMGRDGARGLKIARNIGGYTIAEDESTCIVYGMPKSAKELDAVDCMLPLGEIAGAIAAQCGSVSSGQSDLAQRRIAH